MSKEIIIALMRDKPKHYSKMIQCNPELKSWVIDNAIIKTDNFAELIYSAIHPEINPICDLGNKKLFKGMTDGYSFCGTGGKCACLQELQRNNTTELKAARTSEQRIAEIEKVKQTNLHRYGVENPAQSKEVYAKIKATNLEKYGAESPLQNAQVLEKFKNTNLERYGVEWSQQNKDVREKSKNTMVARYGTEHALQVPEFLKKAGDTCFENHGVRIPATSKEIVDRMIETNIERYGARAPTLNSDIIDKVKNTNVERYGVEWTMQNPKMREKSKNTMIERYGVDHVKQANFSDALLELFKDNELLIDLLKTHTVAELSEKYSIASSTWYNHIRKNDIALPVGEKSKFEKDVYAFVEENYDGVIHSTDKTVLKRKHLDIYLPELNLAIECNGTYWHSEMRNRGKEYHVGKTNECLAKGISLIHVWEHDWSAKQEIIKSMLLHRLGKSKSVFARHTIVNKISSEIANAFYDKNHLQGKCLASIHLGLYHNNELISCMSFGQSRFNKKYEYELIRYANKTNHTVVGGASKLFKYFVKTYDPRSIISYAAKGHTTGNVYLQLGMVHTGVSTPSYSYTRDFVNIYNRQKFQKHKLENLLETFDPNKTEKGNMLINGYTRLWDSGNDIFVWDNS